MQLTKQHLFGLILLVALLATGLLILTRSTVNAQSQTEVGAGVVGQTAFEFIGQADQNALDLVAYGYLTHINGLSDAQLFTNVDPLSWSEATAHFTFQATGKLTARHVVQNLIDTDSLLTMTIYFNDKPAADFKKPASFAAGTAIATLTVHLQQILNVQAPNTGSEISSGDAVQQTGTSFTLKGMQYQFGHANLLAHIAAYGEGKRSEPTAPKSQFVLAGNATYLGNQAP